MKVVGTILAILVLAAIFVGLGYGAFSGCGFLSGQWGSLGADWQAALIVVAALLISCTLFLSISIQSAVKKCGLRGQGKVVVYNEFLNWYSELNNNPEQDVGPESFRRIANQMALWGGHLVSRQTGILYGKLLESTVDRTLILKEARSLHIEIRRDLGLSGTSGKNTIV